MKPNDVKQIRDAFARLSKGVKITEFLTSSTIKVETDFTLINGEPVTFYAYMVLPSKKIYFTDAGRMYKHLISSGQKIQDGVVQALVESYGLILLDGNNVVDQSDRPLHDRIANTVQLLIGVDAMLRTWKGYANKIKTKQEIQQDEE